MSEIEPLLAAITGIIVRDCDPDRVVLFGSWAKGTADRHSDLDVLVIGPFAASGWLRDRELRDALREFPIAIDLHLLTPGEFAIESAKPHGYLNTLQATSRLLYERSAPSCS